ncbi:MAG: T9SS type A sorting domain-containing protein [Bacteroidetes bacterium]|nr:MAG: T9SS type A sorting domain-containing protein [Bacteroidota bacterium]
MKTKDYYFIKSLLISIVIIFVILPQNKLFSQEWNIYYDSPPNVATCTPGVLKQSEKDAVLAKVNKIRSIHGLKPVTYDPAGDAESQAATLIMVANSALSHTPSPSWQCYTQLGYNGASASNLHLSWYSNTSQIPQTLESIYGWMIDKIIINNKDDSTLGHRRAIINPFLSQISFGRCDGQPKVSSQYPYGTSMSLKWIGNLQQNITDWSKDFVAVPYENYPPEFFDREWYLSFSAFYDKVNWSNNVNVEYINATIEMKDENQQNVSVTNIKFDDNLGWGGIQNQLCWKATGLQDHKTYNVTIKNVNVNGTMKSYSYWFNLNNSTMDKPDDPVLFMPPDAATDVTTNPQLQWNPSQRAYKYRVSVSKVPTFTTTIVDDPDVTDYHYSLAGLEPFTKYYWKVAASNEGGESGWSPVWNFTTSGVAPDAPEQVFPDAGEVVKNLTPTLIWKSSEYANSYNLQISTQNDYTDSIVNEQGLTDTTYTVKSGVFSFKKNYYWRVQAVNNIGASSWSRRRLRTDSATSVVEALSGSSNSKISNYPNPFNGKTNISFNVKSSGNVLLKVYNSLGMEISTLVAQRLDAGTYSTEFDGTIVPEGTYFIKLISVSGIETGKMTLIR